MPDSLDDLEQQRAHILRQLAERDDLHAGSITRTGGQCGKSSCPCHRPNDPGHRPHPWLTYKVDAQSVTESFATPAAQRKAESEIETFHRHRELERSYVEVNAKICHARPVEDSTPTTEKKTAEAIEAEIGREVTRLLGLIFAERRQAAASLWGAFGVLPYSKSMP